METRNNYIDNIKGALIFLVVFGHFFAGSIAYSSIFKIIYTMIYAFHVPLFVFISGYLSKNSEKHRDACITSFLGLYLFTVMGYTLFSDLLFGAFEIGSNMSIDLLISKSSMILKNTLSSVFWAIGPAWYLLSLIMWRLITPHFKKTRILIISLFLAILVGAVPQIEYAMSMSRTIVFYPYYLLGYLLNKELFYKYTMNMNKQFRLIAILLLFGIFFLIQQKEINYQMLYAFSSYATCGYNFIQGAVIRGYIYILALIISIAFLWLVPRKTTILSSWGNQSLNIYIWHVFLIPVVEILEKKLSLHILFALIALLISLAACTVFSNTYFERLTDKIKNAFNDLLFSTVNVDNDFNSQL